MSELLIGIAFATVVFIMVPAPPALDNEIQWAYEACAPNGGLTHMRPSYTDAVTVTCKNGAYFRKDKAR